MNNVIKNTIEKSWIRSMLMSFFFLALPMTACQSDVLLLPVDMPVQAPDNTATQVSNNTMIGPQMEYEPSTIDYVTKNPDELRPLLFTPEDLDEAWILDTYEERTSGLLSSSSDNPFEDSMSASMAAEPIPSPNRLGITRGSKYKIIQAADVYADAVTATRVFEEKSEVLQMIYGQLPESVNFEPHVENFVVGCALWHDSRIGEYLNCNFQAQHGRYKIHVYMAVDGELITLQDWEDAINAVHDKLVSYVE